MFNLSSNTINNTRNVILSNNNYTMTFLVLSLLCGLLFPTTALASSEVNFSKAFGGKGGTPFVDMTVPGSRITAITIRSGTLIDNIKIRYRNRNGVFEKSHGGLGGNPKTFYFKKGEYITKFGGKAGKYVDSIYIKTNKGRGMRWGGKGGNKPFAFSATNRTAIVGIWGSSGALIDSIGVIKKSLLKKFKNRPANTLGNQKGLYKFKIREKRTGADSCEKCDSATSTYFPTRPRKITATVYQIHLTFIRHLSLIHVSEGFASFQYKKML